jgi:hypothetical protein
MLAARDEDRKGDYASTYLFTPGNQGGRHPMAHMKVAVAAWTDYSILIALLRAIIIAHAVSFPNARRSKNKAVAIQILPGAPSPWEFLELLTNQRKHQSTPTQGPSSELIRL